MLTPVNANLIPYFKAKHPFDPPGPPGQPRDLSSTCDSITVQWTRPRNDGGSPIQGYVVEKRKVAQNWSRACHATVTDMTLKECYQKTFVFVPSAIN